MVTRGIVEKIVSPYLFKVRMPLINNMDKSGSNTIEDNLDSAVLCTISNINPGISVGDIVFVAFEEDNFGKPVIVGFLFRDNINQTKLDIKSSTLLTTVSANLPQDTTIGNISYENLNCLDGLRENILGRFSIYDEEIRKLKERIEELELKLQEQQEG